MVDSTIYYRNEYFIQDSTTKEFKRKKLDWSIGDKDGHGPYHTPANHVQLERDFQLGIILESSVLDSLNLLRYFIFPF